MEKGVHVLVNRAEEVTVHKTTFLIGGLTTAPEGYEEYGAQFIEEYEKSDDFKLLIAHYPSLYYEALSDAQIDLGICGHYHGGLVRLPSLADCITEIPGFFRNTAEGCTVCPTVRSLCREGWRITAAFPALTTDLNWLSLT